MAQLRNWIGLVLAALLSLVGAFLSLWIVVPAPIFLLLPLGVAVPELSPWLVGLNVTALLLLWFVRPGRVAAKRGVRVLALLSTLALLLSLLPLLQLAPTQQRATQAMEQALGVDYLTRIPDAVQTQLRPAPIIWKDLVRGMPVPAVREDTGISFARPDGVPLELIVYRPTRTGTYPGVVMIYGGAWQWGSPDANAAFGRYLAAQGYVVWAIDYRHAPQYQFPAQLEDVQTALKFIQDHAGEYETDLSRMALLGRSAGAHLAMLAAYQPTPFPVRAVVNYYGPVDLTIGYDDLPRPDPINIRARLRALLGGTPAQRPALYRQASPIEWVRPSQTRPCCTPLPPTLLVYAGRDHLVQAKFGRAMATQLQATGNRAAFIEIPWAEHAFDLVFPGLGSQLTLYYTERFLAWALHSGG